jgi:hypothetical protein
MIALNHQKLSHQKNDKDEKIIIKMKMIRTKSCEKKPIQL